MAVGVIAVEVGHHGHRSPRDHHPYRPGVRGDLLVERERQRPQLLDELRVLLREIPLLGDVVLEVIELPGFEQELPGAAADAREGALEV